MTVHKTRPDAQLRHQDESNALRFGGPVVIPKAAATEHPMVDELRRGQVCRCRGDIGPKSAGPGECWLLCMGLFSRFCLSRDAPPAAEPPCGGNAARAGFGNDPFQMRPGCRREMMSSGFAKGLRRTRFARAAPHGCATRSPQGRSVVPLAGIEPALLAELDFESSASTSSATGAFRRGRRAEKPLRPREAGGL